MHEVIQVNLEYGNYEIHIGNNIWPILGEALKPYRDYRLALVTDQTVDRLYGDKIYGLLNDSGYMIDKEVIEPGESSKTLSTVEEICDRFLDAQLDRRSTVVALGGGVVGDIAGFAAATYMRGIRYVQVPTTLLAQVDSSVGGKTGVNLRGGKNLVGAFHQPVLVLVDTSFLLTLPEREYRTGLAEVVKYGIIRDAALFELLEERTEEVKRREPELLAEIVARCLKIKAGVVSRDEKEQGERAVLNLGHTFGHAFENLTGYKRFTHGEAVSAGIAYASRLAVKRGLLTAGDEERIERLLTAFGLPTVVEGLGAENVIAVMHRDKKALGGRITVILPEGIGGCVIASDVKKSELRDVLA